MVSVVRYSVGVSSACERLSFVRAAILLLALMVAGIGCPGPGTAPDGNGGNLPPGNGNGNGGGSGRPDGARHAPVASDMEMSTAKNVPLTFDLEAVDRDSTELSFRIISAPVHGSLEMDGSGPEVRYTPDAEYSGVDFFAFVAFDGFRNSKQAVVTVNVDDFNGQPETRNLDEETNEDSPVTFSLAGEDPEGELITYSILEAPARGTVSLEGDGPVVRYTPATNYSGSDSFTYVATDGNTLSEISTVSITIHPVNDAPRVRDEYVEAAVASPMTFSPRARDADGDLFTLHVAAEPLHGTVNVGSADGKVTYTSEAGFTGVDTFEIVADDGLLQSPPATMTISVSATTFGGMAEDGSISTDEDRSVVFDLVASGTGSDTMEYSVVSQPGHGRVVVDESGPSARYTPDADYFGDDAFNFVVSDGTDASAPGAVSVTVRPVNDAPEASDDSARTSEDSPVIFDLQGFDIDGDALEFTIVSGASHGTAVINGSGPSVTYTPNASYSGLDTFGFVVNDGTVDSAVATVTITVDPEIDEGPEPSEGWTVFEQAPGARTFYVDPSSGSDSNDGLSPATAVRTIDHIKRTMNDGDWLLLRRGTVFNEPIGGWSTSGISERYRTLVSAYGEGPRPIIRSGSAFGMKFTGPADEIARHVAVTDIAFVAPSDPTSPRSSGISATGAVHDLWFEGLLIDGHAGNIIINGQSSARASNITIRRNVSMYSIHHQMGLHTQGLFIKECDGILVEENYFHHNGWRDGHETVALAHNVYLSQSNGPAVVRRNVSTQSSNNGLMIRSGGVVEDNVLAYNPSGIVVGTEKTDRRFYEVPVTLRNNAVLNATNGGSTVQQWGIIAINLGDSEISGNIVANSSTGDGHGFSLRAVDAFRDVTVRDNISYNVGRGALVTGDTFQSTTLDSNVFGGMTTYFLEFRDHDVPGGISSEVSFLRNVYFDSPEPEPFHAIWTEASTEQRWIGEGEWTGSLEPSAELSAAVMLDPTRDLGSYHGTVGGTATGDAFIAGMLGQAKGSWSTAYEALTVLEYIREGYRPPSEGPPPVPQQVFSSAAEGRAGVEDTTVASVAVDSNQAEVVAESPLNVGLSPASSYEPAISDLVQRIQCVDAQTVVLGAIAPVADIVIEGSSIEAVYESVISLGRSEYEALRPGYQYFVTLAEPLSDGGHLAVVNGVYRHSFSYDDESTVSPAIKVNQVGYLSEADKYGYLGAEIPGVGPLSWGATSFDVVEERTGAVVFSGPVTPRNGGTVALSDSGLPYSGELVSELDFSAMTDDGTYHVQIDGVGRSHSFRVGESALDEFARHALTGGDAMSTGRCLETLFAYLAEPEKWFDGQMSADAYGDGLPDVIEDAIDYLLSAGAGGTSSENFDLCTAFSLAAEAADLAGSADLAADLDRRAGIAWGLAMRDASASSKAHAGAQVMARVRLANRSGDDSMMDGVEGLLFGLPAPAIGDDSWHFYELALRDGSVADWAYFVLADSLASTVNDSSHDYRWSHDAGLDDFDGARFLFIASLVAGEGDVRSDVYHAAALTSLDWMLGANPMGWCLVPGVGEAWPVQSLSQYEDGMPATGMRENPPMHRAVAPQDGGVPAISNRTYFSAMMVASEKVGAGSDSADGENGGVWYLP